MCPPSALAQDLDSSHEFLYLYSVVAAVRTSRVLNSCQWWRILHSCPEKGAVPNLATVFGSLTSNWAHLKTSCQLWTALYFFPTLKPPTGPCHNSSWGTAPASNKISILIVKYRRSTGYFFGQQSHAEIQAAESSCFLAFKLASSRLTEILPPCAAMVCFNQSEKKEMWS